MNQRILLTVNALLVIAVAILFYLQFSNSAGNNANNLSKDESIGLEDTALARIAMESNRPLKIVFIKADSIYVKYEYYNNLKKGIEAKAKRSEAELEGEMKRLEKDYQDAQRRAQSMSKEQVAELEQRFMVRQQQLAQLRDRLSEELAVEEEKLNRQLRDKVQSYFKRISKENKFDYIVSYFPGSNVVWANDSLDITNKVINDLNMEYRSGRNK